MSENQSQSDGNLAQQALKTGRLPKEARLQFAIALLLVACTTSFGNILLKYSLQGDRVPSVSSVSDLPSAALQMATNIWFVIAIILEVSEFIGLIYAMRLGPLSLVIPLRGAATYLLTAFLAQTFLNEQVTLMRWIALSVILVGIIMVGVTGGEE